MRLVVVVRSGFAGVASCALVAAQAPFTEEAVARGISGNVISNPETESYGYGVAFADLDGDGDADLVQVGRVNGAVGLFQNDGTGSFTNRFAGSGVALLPKASGVTCADYDGDGDLDLYITCVGTPNRLYRNDGAFKFSDVARTAGVDDTGAGMGCAWADFDGDGRLDLFLANRTGELHGAPNRLFRNLGDGTFVDVMTAVGIGHGADPTFQAVWFDFDRDGDQDLYLSTDKGYTAGLYNHLYENLGGTFVEITGTSGTAANFDSMGIAVGDFDGDLRLDLYATNTPAGNALFLQVARGVFSDFAASAGVLSNATGWGAVMFDCDNDGKLDLYVCNALAPNRLYFDGQTFPCPDRAAELGVADSGRSYGVAAADIDRDGDVDLAMASFIDPLRLYVNHTADLPAPDNRWLRVRVVGRDANKHAIGAEVEVETTRRQLGHVAAGGSYKCQHDLIQSFGLGAATAASSIRVAWPGGATRQLRNYKAGRTWSVYPNERLGDVNGDGRVGRLDVNAFLACWTGPGPGLLEPGCEMMDLDGDGDVDSADLQRLIARLEPGVATPQSP